MQTAFFVRRFMSDFQSRDRAKQLIDFSGLDYGMTDIDGITEYRDRIWVWCEVKWRGKPIPVGQKLAMERFVKVCQKAKKRCIAIIADHAIDDAGMDIPIKDCIVREVFTTERNGWRKPKRNLTVYEAQSIYIKYWDSRMGA